jgi:hypothetical protein
MKKLTIHPEDEDNIGKQQDANEIKKYCPPQTVSSRPRKR